MDRIVEDEMLVAQFQAGRLDAFDDLMKRYKGQIYAYLLRSVKNYEDAEELTIEVFFKVYRALDTWKPQARFSTWLYKIAHNLSIDFHRAKSRRHTYSLDDEEFSVDEPTAVDLWSNPEWELEEKDRHRVIREAIDQLSPKQKAVFMLNRYQGLQIKEIVDEPTAVDLWSNPEWELEEKDRHRVIREAIDQLSPKQKAVFMLNRYQGLQIKEITEVLGIAEGTVKIHLHRAVRKLQTLLQPRVESLGGK